MTKVCIGCLLTIKGSQKERKLSRPGWYDPRWRSSHQRVCNGSSKDGKDEKDERRVTPGTQNGMLAWETEIAGSSIFSPSFQDNIFPSYSSWVVVVRTVWKHRDVGPPWRGPGLRLPHEKWFYSKDEKLDKEQTEWGPICWILSGPLYIPKKFKL